VTDRDRVIRETFARAKGRGKRVYGFTSEYASCAEAPSGSKVPDDWSHICAEGDQFWARLPDTREGE
jgi:hypothetical protein